MYSVRDASRGPISAEINAYASRVDAENWTHVHSAIRRCARFTACRSSHRKLPSRSAAALTDDTRSSSARRLDNLLEEEKCGRVPPPQDFRPTTDRSACGAGGLAVALAVVVSNACAAGVDLPSAASTQGIAEVDSRYDLRPEERYLSDLEVKYPGFGGFGLDSAGIYRVWVADLGSADAVVRDIQDLSTALQTGAVRPAALVSPRVSRADFTVRTLARVRDLVSDELLGLHTGIVEVGIDGGTNRVSVGVLQGSESTARKLIEGRLHAARLSPLSVVVRVVEMSKADVIPPSTAISNLSGLNSSLTTPNIPVVGGVRQGNYGTGPCTIGIVVSRTGTTGSISNSHCSPTLFGLDAGYQIYNGDVYHRLGGEQVDPSPLGSTVCGAVACRFSDASFSAFDDTVSARRGAIARPINFTTEWGTAGSLSVDQSLRFFAVTSVAQSGMLLPGHYLMKVGQTTGWTEGVVLEPCWDIVLSDNRKRMCSVKSRYYAGGGDSGGPVFFSTGGSGVMMVALHFGSNSFEEYSWASHWHRVVGELGGDIIATTDITVTAPVLSGAIPNGLASITWNVAATTNTILPTTYRVLGFTDNDRFVDYLYGSTIPPTGTSYVRYVVAAENHGVVAGSQQIHFRTTGAF